MAGGAPWVLSQVQVFAEAVATVAFALSGVIEGARKRLDAVGICVVSGLAAFGGGTVRDMVLDRRPLLDRTCWLVVGAAGPVHRVDGVHARPAPRTDGTCDAVARCNRPGYLLGQWHPDRA